MDLEESTQTVMVVCRICLSRRNKKECTDLKVEDPLRAKLSSFVPQMNLTISENPVICPDCSTDLTSALAFKEKCTDTEFKLNAFVSECRMESINLLANIERILTPIKCEQIYVKEEPLEDAVNEFTCVQCGLMCNDKPTYNTHIKSHGKLAFSCDVCGKKYKAKNTLLRHRRVHFNQKHKSDDGTDAEGKLVVDESATDTKIKVKKRTTVPDLPLLCSTCGESCATEKKLRMHMRTHMDKTFRCETCDFTCKHKSSLKVHKRVHAGDITDDKQLDAIYNCNVCNQHFYDRNYLRRHLKIHGEKSCACDMCGKLFSNKGDLGKHRRIHTGEKPYACKICGVRFRVSASLIRHTRAHTGEKPYVCETCGKCFNQKYHLNSHMKIHTGVKEYRCDTCDKSFSHKATLDGHIIKKHAGGFTHKCDVCFKCFSSEENLVSHKLNHQS